MGEEDAGVGGQKGRRGGEAGGDGESEQGSDPRGRQSTKPPQEWRPENRVPGDRAGCFGAR